MSCRDVAAVSASFANASPYTVCPVSSSLKQRAVTAGTSVNYS
jgi:hypothetical protein